MKYFGIKILVAIIALLAVLGSSSCYYDNEAKLYPGSGTCDTTNITYAGTIAPIINTECISCHGGTAPSSGFVLTDYNSLKTYVDNGKLVGSITGTDGFQLMPQSGKMSDCNINKIITWVNAGAPNN